MNTSRLPLITPEPTSRIRASFKYVMVSLYFVFIGFCGVGAWLKWEDMQYQKRLAEYTSHVYEEGFEAVAVTVSLPPRERNENFLERLAQRTTPEPQLVIKPERDENADATWRKYAATPVFVPENNVKVVLVIDDLGIVKGATQEMINMDAPLTLSFLPYASNIAAQVDEAYAKGHDILVHIPMEPKGNADPGPHALLSSTSASEQMDSIDYNLSQFSHYVGINNHMGSHFTEDAEAVSRLLNVVKEKGLLVLDSKTTNHSVLEGMAVDKNIPATNRDVFLDNNRDVPSIMAQLAELERIAKRDGTALAIGHPYPQTVDALKRWIPTLADKGITIIPISQTVSENMEDET